MQKLTIDALTTWTDAGGTWRVVDISPDQVLVDLCACTGEPMQRTCSADPEVIAWIRTAPNPDQDPDG